MKSLISIIIPNYNHAVFLQQRLDSVFNQTYQDFEVVLLDDASTDGSQVLLQKYAEHPKVSHLEINQTNSGSPFKQWQKGIALAKGEYIWIAESDDINDVRFLETYLKALKKEPKVGLFASSINIIGQGTDDFFAPLQEGVYQGIEVIKGYMLKTNSLRNGSSMLFNRSVLQQSVINHLNNFRICGDWWLWVNIMKQRNLYFTERVLTQYRKHEQATTHKLFENPLFYKEILFILNEIATWKITSKPLMDDTLSFWIDRIEAFKSALNDKDYQGLIQMYKQQYSVKKKVKIWMRKMRNA